MSTPAWSYENPAQYALIENSNSSPHLYTQGLDWAGSYRACKRLLAMPDLPDAVRRQTLDNRGFPSQRLFEASGVPPTFGAYLRGRERA
ncbi:hypothetical protein [Streptomyces sp. NPDC058385]|uniref:hypothetical protein n=1 Tax=Streptomyces sp. NPDC058385 TaxID=3346473 RepID=UPI0036678EE4